MAQNDINKEVNALDDDFLGQVAGGRALSLEEQKLIKDTLNHGGHNFDFWRVHGIPNPNSKNKINF